MKQIIIPVLLFIVISLFYACKKETFVSFPLNSKYKYIAISFDSVYRDSNNFVLYRASLIGLHKDGKDNTLYSDSTPIYSSALSNGPENTIYNIIKNDQGEFILRTFNLTSGQFTSQKRINAFPWQIFTPNNTKMLYNPNDKAIYIGCWSKNGIYKIDPSTATIKLLVSKPIDDFTIDYEDNVLYYGKFRDSICQYDLTNNKDESILPSHDNFGIRAIFFCSQTKKVLALMIASYEIREVDVKNRTYSPVLSTLRYNPKANNQNFVTNLQDPDVIFHEYSLVDFKKTTMLIDQSVNRTYGIQNLIYTNY